MEGKRKKTPKGLTGALAVFVLCLALTLACSGVPGQGSYAKQVSDGDTITLSDGRKVRYLGINAPELGKEGRPDQAFAREALELNKKLVLGKPLDLELDRERTDRYGRTLAYVFLKDRTLVNEKILEKGLAWYLPTKNIKYRNRLLRAQEKALAANRGIWKNLPLIREKIYGNTRSKRFHKQSCPAGQETAFKNRVYFSGLREAFEKGFSPCGGCFKTWKNGTGILPASNREPAPQRP